MCVEWVNDWEVATENITAYKVVRKSKNALGFAKYESPTKKETRADQGWGLRAGSIIAYRIGRRAKSDEPGIYCLAHPMLLAEKDMVLLEVVIPKGTKFRRGKAGVPDERGQTFEMRTLNALAVKVVKEFRGKVDKRFNWPVIAHTVQYTWTYITTCSTSSTIIIGKP